MVSYILDASAVLRYLDGEAGSDRVAEILKGHIAGKHRILISAIHWGEVAGIICKRHGRAMVERVTSRLLSFGLEIVPITAERAVNSALIKIEKRIPYADAFGVDLARESNQHVLITADFDVKPAEKEVQIEFLPRKI
jgi:predicted nucleic acid-binding protein